LGVERYDLENGGEIIADYHAISAIPVNFVSLKPKIGHPQLITAMQKRPALVSLLITTEECVTPKLKKGLYGVYVRPKGIPKKLHDALKEGHRVLAAAAKAKAKAEKAAAKAASRKPLSKKAAARKKAEAAKKAAAKKKADEKKRKKAEARKSSSKKSSSKKKKSSSNKWQTVVASYGYSDKEIAETKVEDLIKYVYVRHTGTKEGENKLFKISTESTQMLFRERRGKWIAAVPTLAKIVRAGSKEIVNMVNDPKTVPGSNEVHFQFGVMLDQHEFKKFKKSGRGRGMPFDFKLVLTKPWK
jgi:hypothetical protein